MNLNQLNSNFNSLPKEFSKNLEGHWVAVSNGEIICSNESFKKVFADIAKLSLAKKVLFHKVPKKEIIIV